MDAIGKQMHIDRTHEITVSAKPAGAACPGSPFGLVFVPACRTPARCPSFGAGEAHDAGCFGFMREVVDVPAVFPQGHALVVMASPVLLSHALRVADEERSDDRASCCAAA